MFAAVRIAFVRENNWSEDHWDSRLARFCPPPRGARSMSMSRRRETMSGTGDGVQGAGLMLLWPLEDLVCRRIRRPAWSGVVERGRGQSRRSGT